VDDFMDSLEESPAPFLSQNTVVSIDKQDVLGTIFQALYQPQREFPHLATVLSEAMAGNFTQLYEGLGSPKSINSCSSDTTHSYTWKNDAQRAIACGDGVSQANLTIPEFMEYLASLQRDSPDFGAPWTSIRIGCKGWLYRPKYSFSGPWVTPEADPNLVEGKPAAPLLFISSRYDPVTPLLNAHVASKEHPGSTVLVQENVGHGSIHSPGKCREDFVRKYFETGELPPEGTVCQPDCTPFQGCPQMKPTAALGIDGTLESWHRRTPLAMF
jgi:pimeloyl-ACP methyl ester carboxylesterase